MEVGLRELRRRLNDYLARVRHGEEVVVTECGTAIARIVPIDRVSVLDRAIADGLVAPAVNPVRTRPHRRIQAQSKVSDLLAEQRR